MPLQSIESTALLPWQFINSVDTNYLNKVLGLKKEDNYFYGNDYFSVTDVSNLSDNVLSGEDGHLYFIDPIIKLKKPALEVLDFLYKTKCK